MSGARFRPGDRVETANYGRAEVVYYYRDRNLGWTYTVRVERDDLVLLLVEEVLAEIPAVVRLAELV